MEAVTIPATGHSVHSYAPRLQKCCVWEVLSEKSQFLEATVSSNSHYLCGGVDKGPGLFSIPVVENLQQAAIQSALEPRVILPIHVT